MLIIVSPYFNNPNKVRVNACVPDIICGLTIASSALKISAYIFSNFSLPAS